MTFERQIKQYIEQQALFTNKESLLVTLSGGADSVALLRVLCNLGYNCEAAHCNFHLRGEESDRDEAFVRSLCEKLRVSLHITHFDTKGYAAEKHISIEMAARELRYAYFEELRKECHAAVIAVAHHCDDSVETFLLNLIRGTGINGLRGIQVRNGFIVRPLLGVSRKDIIEYLQSLGQDYVTDSTNLQDEYMRNKVRLNILPLMKSINPVVMQNIADTAAHLREVAQVYNAAITESCNRVMDNESGILSIPSLLKEISPKAILFEIFYPLGFNPAQIDDLFCCLQGESGRRFVSKEWEVLKDRDCLVLRRRKEPVETEMQERQIAEFCLPVKPDNSYHVQMHGQEIVFCCHTYTSDFVIPREKSIACIDAELLVFPLTVRCWREGDKFIPFGMKGKKLISDYLIDRKYSLYQKESQLVICDGKERIVWLVGERSDNRFRVSPDTKEVMIIQRKF